MSDLREVAERLLNETIAYYNSTNRAISGKADGSCAYTTKDGRHCAIGRVLDPKFRAYLFQQNLNVSVHNIIEYVKWDGDKLIEPYQQLLSNKEYIEFLQHLQSLHDAAEFWSEQGLTKAGEKRVKFIKRIFKFS